MRSLLILFAILVQFGQRPPLSPAETLLEPRLLGAIHERLLGAGRLEVQRGGSGIGIVGTDQTAGEIILMCGMSCDGVLLAEGKLRLLIAAKRLPPPSRAIRLLPTDSTPPPNTRVVILLMPGAAPTLSIVRGPWSTAGVGDEVVELFARHVEGDQVAVKDFANTSIFGPRWDPYGIATTTILYNDQAADQAAFVAAASAYFLATLPNAGAEALLSHLTVGAQARLAEDARKAVAQMGTQQRASADVLIMFGQAIEREQRRMRSFERFMPAPVDPMLRSRLADMEKGITGVWTSMGITSSPFVPAAERIRGRGGEDRRVPSRLREGPLPTADPPTAMLKFPNVADVLYELGNFIDGKRSISDIRDAVSAEFGPIALPVVVDYFERLAKTGAVSIR